MLHIRVRVSIQSIFYNINAFGNLTYFINRKSTIKQMLSDLWQSFSRRLNNLLQIMFLWSINEKSLNISIIIKSSLLSIILIYDVEFISQAVLYNCNDVLCDNLLVVLRSGLVTCIGISLRSSC